MSCSVSTSRMGFAGSRRYFAAPYRQFAKEVSAAVAIILLTIAFLALVVFVLMLSAGVSVYALASYDSAYSVVTHTLLSWTETYGPALALLVFIMAMCAFAWVIGHRELTQNEQLRTNL